MGMYKITCELIYWPGINSDTKKTYKNCSTCLEFQQTNQRNELFTMKFLESHGKLFDLICLPYIKKLSLHCRLSQQVPYNQEDGRPLEHQPHSNM